MHIPDGFVSTPVNLACAAAATAAVGVALVRARGLDAARTQRFAIATAFVFAAQMLNVQIAHGTSGHLVGAALLTVIAGPAAALLGMTLVLAVQCFAFHDGGLSALGSNVLNLAVIGVGAAWLAQRLTARAPSLVSVGFAAWASVLAAAGACAVQLVLSGHPLVVLPEMLGIHAVIGLGEAAITVAVLAAAGALRQGRLVAAQVRM
jgi:cobalt/nickel transport system permease protein